ncbi:phosphatidylserine/phosphatidylglycerophosphate/cardiolipin synthase [Longilinea arvoryzae]|uniref:phospholipase D n=1 Tax=Longilinea arvoryzae TaxID=360412 RepID=A0A0S7BCA4_9CHLR|nr:phospholipase D-like domain-containing protein [Longilinea arvoryzae]GAP12400.1 phosphatidylserine/phosphatidylglycerophosphate/cardiolipin synthase [Longilinea arvoryzae]
MKRYPRLFFALCLAALVSACDLTPAAVLPADPPAAVATVAPTEAQSDAISVYFTDPDSALAAEGRGGPDEALAAAIAAAQSSVDMAMYNLSLPSIGDALLEAYRRGVVVRLVVDDETYEDEISSRLRKAGIPVVSDQREELMHNKFTILDGQEVWTGSLNLSTGGTYSDYNNLVRIRSTRLAQDYTAEFEEMFLDHQFGENSPMNTIYPRLTVDGRTVEVYFLPEDDVEDRLLDLVGSAHDSVDFLAYSFTLDYLADTMIDLENNGIRVRGIMDAEQEASNQGGEYDRLVDAGLDVRLDPFDGLLHHKVIIVDGQWVVLGSANFTRSGLFKNDENLVILNDPTLASSFETEFERLYSLSRP